jgi:DNA-binding XRE family transcriptional regulator
MRKRLTQLEVDAVRRRLAAGLSQRDISSDLGVSRSTISAINNGKHVLRQYVERDALPAANGKWVFCPVCRCKVKSPCLACHLRHLEANGTMPPRARPVRDEPKSPQQGHAPQSTLCLRAV